MKNKKSILIVISNFGDEQIEYLKKDMGPQNTEEIGICLINY